MIYGAGAAGLVATAWGNYGIVMSLNEAEHARRAFLTRYATYADWMIRHHQQCASTGIIRIGLLGRVIEAAWEKRQATNGTVRGAPDDGLLDEDDILYDEDANPFGSQLGWAQAQLKYTLCCNAPIQGACADAGMLALTAIDRALQHAGIPGGPVLFVHDEIVLEVPEQYAEQAMRLLESCMRKAFAVTFPGAPLSKLVSIGIGKTWGAKS
jgi:DNA polymerase I-like protein with 3'-5' exonuclease and polymerase domains